MKDIKLIQSPSWTINPILCSNATFDNLTILNPADSPNTDGIDPESCKNVRISNCHIDVGDDCIAIKAGTEDTYERIACENITITNCTMVHG
ncbi:glycosyl hydrolase family 28 protein, partial [Pseudomonas aeruginosa]|uniref:glycosyl hydrolase family 28 protein n=1 Tax=Pseudomonas aeruginosa TaxID=287 RepID=UPI0038920FC6